MTNLSKAQWIAKAQELGLDADESWTVKQLQAAVEDVNANSVDEECELGFDCSDEQDKCCKDEVPAAVAGYEPVPVFPARGVRRLPSVVRLPHRGARRVRK